MSEPHRTKKGNKCLRCGARLDAAAGIQDGPGPSEGCLSICIKCGHATLFTADLSLREITPEEWKALPADNKNEIAKAQRLIRAENARLN